MAACALSETLCAGLLAPFRMAENALAFILPPVAGASFRVPASHQPVSGHASVSPRGEVRVLVSMLPPAPYPWRSGPVSFVFPQHGARSHKTPDCRWRPATATSPPEPGRAEALCHPAGRPCLGAT